MNNTTTTRRRSLLMTLIMTAAVMLYCLSGAQALTDLEGDIFENYENSTGIRYHQTRFDYIIVGLGPAGAILAERLSENTNFKVLVLEAGGSDNYLEVRAPPLFSALYDPTQPNYEETSWAYHNEQPEFLQRGRNMSLPRIKLFGGCASGNTMAMFRGDRRDYDDWQTKEGLPLNWNVMLPYFKKTEKSLFPNPNTALHGVNGEYPIGPQSYTHPITTEFVQAVNQRLNYPIDNDFNDGYPWGAGYAPVNIVNGFRVGIHNVMITEETLERTNLLVKLNHHVTKVLFNPSKTRAVGVEFKNKKTGHMERAYASKEVILSAGAYNSPHLLLLSGIGDRTELRAKGIDVVKHLPGVGKNLLDHLLVGVSVNTTGVKTFESIFDSDEALAEAFDLLFNNGTGPLASNVGEGYAPVNTGVDNRNYPANKADVIFEMGPLLFALDGLLSIPGVHAVSAGPDLMAVDSKGYVKLRSSNPFDKPIINHNYLSNSKEVDRLISGLRTLRTLFRNMLGNRYVNELLPGPNVNTRAEFVEYLYNYGMTGYHPCCSAKMGRRSDPNTVVDSDYKVIGIDNLRVVDGSSLPTLTTANIQLAIMAMAERAADIISRDNGGNGGCHNTRPPRWTPRTRQGFDRRTCDAYSYLKRKYRGHNPHGSNN